MGRVARIAVDQSFAHLDQLFDYVIPDSVEDVACVGARVRVSFSNRATTGFIVEIVDESEQPDLIPIQKVVSSEPIMVPSLYALIRQIANHYGGTFADVARLAIPPRHALSESSEAKRWTKPNLESAATVLPSYPTGSGFLDALARGDSPRAMWQIAPTRAPIGDWAGGVLDAAAATFDSGRSALVIVPDERDLTHVSQLAQRRFGRYAVAVLHSHHGPARRYRNFLAASRGDVSLTIGTRGADFTPMHNLGLVAIFDDGQDVYVDPKAPYPHARDVLAMRASAENTAFLLASYARTAEAQQWINRGWLGTIELSSTARRRSCARVQIADDYRGGAFGDQRRLPSEIFAGIAKGLLSGSVLVSVPRAGFATHLRCASCRERALCRNCNEPLRYFDADTPSCRSCGISVDTWACEACGHQTLASVKVGVDGTAEDLRRAFPYTDVVSVSASNRPKVGERPTLVLATPGLEPDIGGYSCAIILDSDYSLTRPDLRTNEETLRRWLSVAALVRPNSESGVVFVVGDPGWSVVASFVSLDAAGAADVELADRAQTGFPPAAKLAEVTGTPDSILAFLDAAQLDWAERIGDVDASRERSTIMLRAPLERTSEFLAGIRRGRSDRSANKRPGLLRVRIDPYKIGTL